MERGENSTLGESQPRRCESRGRGGDETHIHSVSAASVQRHICGTGLLARAVSPSFSAKIPLRNGRIQRRGGSVRVCASLPLFVCVSVCVRLSLCVCLSVRLSLCPCPYTESSHSLPPPLVSMEVPCNSVIPSMIPPSGAPDTRKRRSLSPFPIRQYPDRISRAEFPGTLDSLPLCLRQNIRMLGVPGNAVVAPQRLRWYLDGMSRAELPGAAVSIPSSQTISGTEHPGTPVVSLPIRRYPDRIS